MMNRVVTVALGLLWLGFLTPEQGSGQTAPDAGRPFTIGVVKDGPCPLIDNLQALVQQELDILVGKSRPVRFKDAPEFNARWQPGQYAGALQAALQDPEVDLVFASGIFVARAAVNVPGLPKPVISGFVEDPDFLGIPCNAAGYSTKTNYTFVLIPISSRHDLESFHQLVAFTNLGVMVDEVLVDAVATLSPGVQAMAEKNGFTVTLIPMGDSVDAVLAAVSNNVDALYLAPPLRLDFTTEWPAVIAGLNARKLPTFAMLGHPDVRNGALAGILPDAYDRLARRLALDLQQIMNGTPPEQLIVPLILEPQLLINGRTARQIDFRPSFDVMISAQCLYEDEIQRHAPLGLDQAMQMALEGNAELAAKKAETAAARQDRNKAGTTLLPQLEANGMYSQIDRDRAEASMGMQAEKSSSVGFKATQIVYNDPAMSQYRAEMRQYEGSQAGLESTRLDVLDSSARYFISFLQAWALLRIDADNLRLTQNNLELARVRHQIGAAGPEEVYRWETQAASQRSTVIKSASTVEKARTALNQVMGVDLLEPWTPVDIQVSETNYFFLHGRLDSLLQDERDLAALQTFIAREALANSPTVRELDYKIAALKIMYNEYRRRFVVPEAALSFDYDHYMSRDYLGGINLNAMTGTEAAQADRDEWMLGFQVTLPFFNGGGNIVDVLKGRAQLDQLEASRRRAQEQTAQQAYSVFYALSSSFPAIKLQREAAHFAGENLRVVKDKYARGAVSILDVLDAQNQSFVANQNAALAVYTFLGDIMTMQRVMCWFEVEKTEAEKDRWIAAFKQVLESDDFPGYQPPM